MVGWFGLAQAMTVTEVPDPRRRGRWVADAAEVIGERDEAALNEQLVALHRDLRVDVAIVTVPTVDGTPVAFANDLFDHWGLGDARADNGLLVLLVIDQRRTEMVTGAGLDAVLPDPYLVEVQQRHLVPRFAKRKFGLGLLDGMEPIDRRLREHPEDARLGVDGPSARAASEWVGDAAAAGTGLAAVGVGVVAAVLVSARRRRREERTCDRCAMEMPRLERAAERARLTPGQQSEQQLGSVDHQIHQCPKCRQVRAFAVPTWLAATKCPRCQNLTCTTHRECVTHASPWSNGEERVTERCHHCGASSTEVRVTPRKRPRFGHRRRHHSHGGGGGGAGTSW
ncbi:MAG: TPM domain-containing protein [Myxococcota bacterium]